MNNPGKSGNALRPETEVVLSGRTLAEYGGSVNPPVHHVSTVVSSSMEEFRARMKAREDESRTMYYGRKGTPTSWALEDAVARLEGGHRALAFPSGLAAVSSALFAFLRAGDHLLMTDSTYSPTRVFCDSVLARFGVETTYYPPRAGVDIRDLLRSNTTVVFTESPGSHTFEVQDIPAIAEIAHSHGAKVLMDNSWASPLYFKPFEHGVDVSIQAATKYIVGHSDAMLGTVSTTSECWPMLKESAWQMGQCAGPDDLYLAQRGLRTLAVRLRRHHENGLVVAEWLQRRPEVRRVLHPALSEDPGHALWKRDFLGASGLFGIELHPCPEAAVEALLDRLNFFHMGYSWGGYESLIVPSHVKKERLPGTWDFEGQLLRIHVGLEDPRDLIDDFSQGLEHFNRKIL